MADPGTIADGPPDDDEGLALPIPPGDLPGLTLLSAGPADGAATGPASRDRKACRPQPWVAMVSLDDPIPAYRTLAMRDGRPRCVKRPARMMRRG